MKDIERFLLRPRYLRAIPSLVVLTTAMAWAALPDVDTSDEVNKKPGVSQMQPSAGVAAASTVMSVNCRVG
ncbi:MAG: hypothetical protein V4772_01800 [Pseudomonadota bacterium]